MTTSAVVAQLEKRGCNPRPKGASSWMAECPAHHDSKPSLSIAEGRDGRTLVKCFAGCDFKDIVAAAGLKPEDLFAERQAKSGLGQIIAEYDYRDENGALLFQAVRFEPKSFRQRTRLPNGEWSWRINGVQRVLYRLPEVLAAVKRSETVFVCEGEKDVASMVEQGVCATCNPMGAGKWQSEYTDTLTSADIVVIADKDAPGRKHAADVAASLQGTASRVRVVELPDIGGKSIKDAHDFFTAGGTAKALRSLAEAVPDWTPPSNPVVEKNADSSPSDIRGEILGLLTGKASPATKRSEIVKAVLRELSKAGRFYFHAELRDFNSAYFFHRHRRRLERIRSDGFFAWLSDWLAINRADPIFKYIQAAVETEALSGPTTTGILPESFWASRPGAIYMSCGDGGIVKITANGFAAVDNGTDGVLFAADQTLAPWNYNAKSASILDSAKLFRDSQCTADHGRDLFTLWIYGLPYNPRCKPPLVLSGDVGSGKTRLAKGICELLGIPFIAAKVEDDRQGDFWPSMDQGGIFTLDNADTRCRWLADAVANAATDGCSRRRKLYTNSDTVLLRARAWLVVTTANPTFANDPGLADRLLLVRMNRRIGNTSDEALSQEIAQNRDAGLVHIAETLAAALADQTPPKVGLNARHPDFAAMAVKIGRAMERETEAISALSAAEADKSSFCLENDSTGLALLAFLRADGKFEGTAAELREKLIEADPDLQECLSVKKLGKRLNTIWAHLAQVLDVARKTQDRKGFSVYRFVISTPEPKTQSAEFAEFQTVIP